MGAVVTLFIILVALLLLGVLLLGILLAAGPLLAYHWGKSRPKNRTWLRRGVDDFRAIVVGVTIILSISVSSCAIFWEMTKLKGEYIVMPIEVPQQLKEKGYTPEMAARYLIAKVDEIMIIDSPSFSEQTKAAAIFLPGGDIEDSLTLPTTNLPITSVAFYLRRLLGWTPKVVTGEFLYAESDDGLSLRLRLLIDREIVPEVPGLDQGTTVDQQFAGGARKVVWKIVPHQLVRYYFHEEKDLPSVKKLAPLLLAKYVDTQDEAEAVNVQGIVLFADGEYKKAIEKFKQANQLNSEHVPTFINWGYALATDQKKYEEAIKKYERAIELNPRHVWARYSWGIVLARTGFQYVKDGECSQAIKEYEKAIEKFQQAISIHPKFAPAYYAWGTVLHHQADACLAGSEAVGKYDEASKKYEKAIERDPEHVFSYVTWGRILAKKRRIR